MSTATLSSLFKGNMRKQENLVEATVKNFKNEVDYLIKSHSNWQANEFKASNEMLYCLLSKIFELYLQSKGGDKADARKRAWLVRQCEERGITFKSNKPTLIQLITKLVFCDSLADSKRVNSYARVLNTAAQSPKVTVASEIPEFIREHGGIEEVRAATAKNTKSPSVRAEHGRKLLDNRNTLQTVTNKIVKTNAATAKGKIVLLVGIATAQGTVEIKDVCFEEAGSKLLISNKTAVKTVLSTVYSTDCHRNKDIEQKLMVETDSQNQHTSLLHADETFDAEELVAA